MTILHTNQGGTGSSAVPTPGQIPIADANGNYQPTDLSLVDEWLRDPDTGIISPRVDGDILDMLTGGVIKTPTAYVYDLLNLDSGCAFGWKSDGGNGDVFLQSEEAKKLIFTNSVFDAGFILDYNSVTGESHKVLTVPNLEGTIAITDAVLTAGSVPFVGTDGILTQDNSNFFWDNTNKKLGIRISPVATLHIAETDTSSVIRGLVVDQYSADGSGATNIQRKSRSATVGAYGRVQKEDTLASWQGYGSGDTGFFRAGMILIAADEACGDNDMPGRISFWTTPNGSATSQERGRINNAGDWFIGTTDTDGTPAIGRLTVKGSTNDGTTNIFVGRDSDEVNVFTVETNGRIYAEGLANLSTGANSLVQVLSTGTVIYRNVADANSALTVHLANSSSTGNIQVWQFNSVSKAFVNSSGTFATPTGLMNYTNANNAYVNVATTGTTISRNVADTNAALIVNQAHASSTGSILLLQAVGAVKFKVAYDGTTELINNTWLRAKDQAGTSFINMFKVNTANEIEVGGVLNVGTIGITEDSGAVTLVNLPISATPTAGTEESYSFSIDSTVIAKVYGEANGTGGLQNPSFRVSAPVYSIGTYGEIYGHDNATAQSIPTGATYTKITTAFTANGLYSGTTVDEANGKITILKAGKYRVFYTLSYYSGANNATWYGAVFNDGTECNNIHSSAKITTATDIRTTCAQGIITVAANKEIDFRVRHDQAGAVDITPVYINLNVEYLGE